MSKKSQYVGKRFIIDWRHVLFTIEDDKLHRMYFAFKSKHDISANRCALYVLKKFYSTTTVGLCMRFKLVSVDQVLGMSLDKFKQLSVDFYEVDL